MKKVLLGVVLVTSIFAKTNLSLSIGSNNFDSKENVDTATSLGIREDFYLDNLYHIDIGYDNLGTIGYKNSTDSTKVQRFYTQFSADGEEEYHVVPYMGIGLGYEMVSNKIDEFKSQPYLSLGLGFRYNISNNFNFLLDGKALWKTSTRNINYLTTFGVGYMLDNEPVNNQEIITQEVIVPKQKLDIPQVQNTTISSIFSPATTTPVVAASIKRGTPVQSQIITPMPRQSKPISCATSKTLGGSYIQVAAFSQYKPKALLSRLTKAGHHVVLKKSGSITKALVGPFRSANEALNALSSVKSIKRDAFIYKGNF